MHESGIVEELVRQLEKVVRDNGGARVVRVGLGMGELAGFSRDHFEEHFRAASKDTIAEGAALDIHITSGDALTLEDVEVEDS